MTQNVELEETTHQVPLVSPDNSALRYPSNVRELIELLNYFDEEVMVVTNIKDVEQTGNFWASLQWPRCVPIPHHVER